MKMLRGSTLSLLSLSNGSEKWSEHRCKPGVEEDREKEELEEEDEQIQNQIPGDEAKIDKGPNARETHRMVFISFLLPASVQRPSSSWLWIFCRKAS